MFNYFRAKSGCANRQWGNWRFEPGEKLS